MKTTKEQRAELRQLVLDVQAKDAVRGPGSSVRHGAAKNRLDMAAREAIMDLLADIEELRAALRPFAEYGEGTEPTAPESNTLHEWMGKKLTVGDFRRAAEALGRSKP